MHERLANELVFRLARRALAIVAPRLREGDKREAFDRFHRAFKDELLQYEVERERMEERLKGHRAPRGGVCEQEQPGGLSQEQTSYGEMT